MFTIKDGAVQAAFKIDGKDVVETLALADVKVAVEQLALVGLARVSRETVAGKQAEEDHKAAHEKLVKRWNLWKAGTWETDRAKGVKLTAEEIEGLAWDYFRYLCTVTKTDAAMVDKAQALVAKKDKTAVAKWDGFKKTHAKAISNRIREVVKARKSKADLTY